MIGGIQRETEGDRDRKRESTGDRRRDTERHKQ